MGFWSKPFHSHEATWTVAPWTVSNYPNDTLPVACLYALSFLLQICATPGSWGDEDEQPDEHLEHA